MYNNKVGSYHKLICFIYFYLKYQLLLSNFIFLIDFTYNNNVGSYHKFIRFI